MNKNISDQKLEQKFLNILFLMAAETGDLEQIKQLMCSCSQNHNVFYHAYNCKNLHIADYLLDNLPEADRDEVFILGCVYQHTEAISYMIDHGIERTKRLDEMLREKHTDAFRFADELFVMREQKHLLEQTLQNRGNTNITRKI